MNFRGTLFRWMQDFSNQSERQLWILNSNLAGKIQGYFFRNDQARSSALVRSFKKLFIFDVGDVSFAGGIETADTRNQNRAIAGNAATNVRGKFRNCHSFLRHHYFVRPDITTRPAKSRMAPISNIRETLGISRVRL